MKYSEAEKQIKALSDKYSVEMNGKDFYVVYDGKLRVAYVDGVNKYGLHADYGAFLNMPANDELFMILAYLAKTPLDERVEETKQYVKVFDNEFGYLNIDDSTGKTIVSGMPESYGYKTKFTDKEIEQLKQRDDIPLDWDKVELEEEHD
ncbi:hypothetical protein IMAU10062_01260 [Lactiplantibacillus plantarum]|nr:hypothetical protein [Lactiplantibacillus plantarum]